MNCVDLRPVKIMPARWMQRISTAARMIRGAGCTW
jgi:hypothetical protein